MQTLTHVVLDADGAVLQRIYDDFDRFNDRSGALVHLAPALLLTPAAMAAQHGLFAAKWVGAQPADLGPDESLQEAGGELVDGIYEITRAVEPAPTPSRLLQVSPPTFKMLFTPTERLAIRAARSYAGADEQALTIRAVIEDWYEIIDDPRLNYVDLALAQTQAGITFLVTAGIITQERCDEILTGVEV